MEHCNGPWRRGLWPCLLAGLLVWSLSCVRGAVEVERDHARTLTPASLESAPSAPTATRRRSVRVRVYAEDRYRAQVPRWQQDVREQLRRATAAVEGTLGVVFELESAHPWTLSSDRMDLDSALIELEQLDSAQDVDLVVGFLPALSLFSAAHNDLGRARAFGQHAVLHGMESREERMNIMTLFTQLPEAERQALYRERKLHKETSILLHEWAHTLGAFHVQDARWMMHPLYEIGQAAFAPQTLQLLAVSLRHMPQARQDPEARKAWAREVRELLTATSWPGWDGPEKTQALLWTERVLAGQVPLRVAEGPPLSRGDLQQLNEALALERSGRLEDAARLLEPLAQRNPGHERVQTLACYLSFRVAPALPSTQERCEATAAGFPTESSALMVLAHLRLNAKDAPGARAHLAQAQRRLQERAPEDPGLWAYFAGLLMNASCVTWAEQAAAKAPDGPGMAEVRVWSTRTRRLQGLPRDPARSGVSPEREGEFLDRVIGIGELLDRGTLAPARQQVAQLAKDFPGAAVLHVLQCELHARSRQLGPARTACRRALEVDEELVRAHLLLGTLATQTGAGEEARTHLERTIALAPEYEAAWRMLARLYRTGGQAQALQALQARYRAQFSADLP